MRIHSRFSEFPDKTRSCLTDGRRPPTPFFSLSSSQEATQGVRNLPSLFSPWVAHRKPLQRGLEKETRHANESSRSDCPCGQPASTLFDVGVSSGSHERA